MYYGYLLKGENVLFYYSGKKIQACLVLKNKLFESYTLQLGNCLLKVDGCPRSMVSIQSFDLSHIQHKDVVLDVTKL